jgi:hypothetical protein
VLELSSENFNTVAQQYPEAQKALLLIKTTINAGNYKYLKLQCYICESHDHISIDCPDFKSRFEGNIKTYFEKIR